MPIETVPMHSLIRDQTVHLAQSIWVCAVCIIPKVDIIYDTAHIKVLTGWILIICGSHLFNNVQSLSLFYLTKIFLPKFLFHKRTDQTT